MRESSSSHTFQTSLKRNATTGFLVPWSANVDFVFLAECLSGPKINDSEGTEDEEVMTHARKRRKGKENAVGGKLQPPAKRTKLLENVLLEEPTSSVLVLCHVFEIDFSVTETLSSTSGAFAVSEGRDFLCALAQRLEGQSILNFGAVYPHAHAGQVQLCTRDPLAKASRNPLPMSRIMTLPSLLDDVKDSDYDFHTKTLKDILASAYVMQIYGRARVTGRLDIVWTSLDLVSKDMVELPLKFRVTVQVSFLTPMIFRNLSTSGKKAAEEDEAQRRMCTYVFGPGEPRPAGYAKRTNMQFFLSCLKPAPARSTPIADLGAQPEKLRAQLLPFQRRSVAWLLEREGKLIDDNGRVHNAELGVQGFPLFWEEVSPSTKEKWYLNRVTGHLLPQMPSEDENLGGILAEEPGLGKTLEAIALVLLNPDTSRNPEASHWDPVGRIDAKEIKTTLVVTPASLSQQWIEELERHAPSLKFLVYDGWTKLPVPITEREAKTKVLQRLAKKYRVETVGSLVDEKDFEEVALSSEDKEELDATSKIMTWCTFINQYDVCITTYNVLQQDLGVARPPIQRPRREVAMANYQSLHRDRSPLVMVEWLRVIMDEVQMVGGGKTEEMVSLIPRISSFAVSGTPARANVDDLIHVLNFLRVESVTDAHKAWTRLQKPAFSAYFKALFGKIAVRTVKAKVQNELTIPQQRRFVVPIELGKVEKHVYDQNMERALNDLGLDARGVAASSGYQIDVSVLRSWMRKLRAVCTHPQVGQLARQNDKLVKAGAALKSISEVLENMKDQNWRSLADEKKSKIQALIKKAQLVQQDEMDEQRYQSSRDILLEAKTRMDILLDEIKNEIVEHDKKGETLKQVSASLNETSRPDNDGTSKGKGKRREDSVPLSDDAPDDGLPKTPAGEEHRYRKNALQARLRECHIVMHQIFFRLGDVYHVLGEEFNALEAKFYTDADDLRKHLLKSTEVAANQSIRQLKSTPVSKEVKEKDMKIEHCGKGGIKNEEILREADEIIDVLNDQTRLLFEWKTQIYKLLTESLTSSEGEGADGEEYSRSLDTQGQAEALMQAYSALVADRREVLIAERTALAAHDVRERKIRHTAAAAKAAAVLDNPSILNVDEVQPEHEVLQKELEKRRKKVRKGYKGRAIQTIIVDLRGVSHSIIKEDDPEKIIAKDWHRRLSVIKNAQLKLHEKLESDMSLLRKAFNDRVQYFRQLQELSDTVASIEYEGTLEDAIKEAEIEAADADKKINEYRAKQRYLESLADRDEDEDEDNTCVICRSEFVRGFVTQCAHVFCEPCMKLLLEKSGKTCPVCRVIIDTNQLRRVTMNGKGKEVLEAEREAKTHKRPVLRNKEDIPQTTRVIEYNTIDKDLLEEIQRIDSLGSYGSKIETLVKHVLYLQDSDPGSKSIVFSAWADSLYILELALTGNGIGCMRIDQKRGKMNAVNVFKSDPSISVLLLHGERENAGLNITCASRVFLVESVVQHAFEIQAIARIDRMGQTRPTEVYCYYAENTVEKGILDLAAKRGLSLYTKDRAVGTLQVKSFDMEENDEIDAPSKKQKGEKGDFIGKADDMLEILFPWMFEDDIRYLFTESSDVDMQNLQNAGDDGADFIDEDEEAITGPSRLS